MRMVKYIGIFIPTLFAGSRFKYLPPKIEFGYQQLVDAITKAIEDQERLDGVKVVDKLEPIKIETLDYNALYKEASELWEKLVQPTSEHPNIEMAQKMIKKLEMTFGHPIKLSEITEDQVSLLELVVMDI